MKRWTVLHSGHTRHLACGVFLWVNLPIFILTDGMHLANLSAQTDRADAAPGESGRGEFS